MDHIDQTISHLRAQITALHNNTMSYQPINPYMENAKDLCLKTLQDRVSKLEEENTRLKALYTSQLEELIRRNEKIEKLTEDLKGAQKAYLERIKGR